ncbi:hypothetical protein, partial [Klebsiella pneumoniae]|uniref:hypothetical protein n=1 Tax=Klebsiella pneumoniae TaxID=573 RepID=UPI0013D83057
EKSVADAVDVLIAAANHFIAHTKAATTAEDTKNKIIAERTTPEGIAAAELVARTVGVLQQSAAEAKQNADTQATQAAAISL